MKYASVGVTSPSALATEIKRFTDERAARDSETEQSHEENSGTPSEADANSKPASLLSQFSGGQSE